MGSSKVSEISTSKQISNMNESRFLSTCGAVGISVVGGLKRVFGGWSRPCPRGVPSCWLVQHLLSAEQSPPFVTPLQRDGEVL